MTRRVLEGGFDSVLKGTLHIRVDGFPLLLSHSPWGGLIFNV